MSDTSRPQRPGRWRPFALVALGAIPVIAGTLRLSELAGGPPVLPFKPRIAASPAPAVIHVASAILYLGVTAVRRHDFAEHQAWMIRAYALAAGAGTQVFTLGISESLFGAGELTSGLALGAGWAINLTVAEYIIGRSAAQRRHATSPIGA